MSNSGGHDGSWRDRRDHGQGRSRGRVRSCGRGRSFQSGGRALSASNSSLSNRGTTSHYLHGHNRAQAYSLNQWICEYCGYENYATRENCRKCSSKKKGGRTSNVSRGGQNIGRSDRNRSNKLRVQKDLNLGGNPNDSPIIDAIKYIELLEKSKSVLQTVEQSLPVYLKTWKHCRQLTASQVETLIITMAKLPSSFYFETPPMVAYCKTGAEVYIDFHKMKRTEKDYAETVVQKIENVINFVKRLMDIEWDESCDEVKTELSAILNKVNSLIVCSEKEHRRLVNDIDKVLEDMEKPWKITSRTAKKESSGDAKPFGKREAASRISSWENTTVAWLTDQRNFQPSHLPRMKVPDDNSSMGVYTNKEEYFNIVCRLWIGLTFSDGNAALNPKCRHKMGSKECGMVLWSVDGAKENAREFCRKCKKTPVILVCQNYTHKSALCKKCCKQIKNCMMGPAGPQASTHLYDFMVRRVDFEGRIYMTNMVCRRPPQQPVHWRSTSRLKVTCLVAIVKVPEKDASLKMSDSIIWAEVAVHADAKDEFRRREQGQMVVSDLRDRKDECQLRRGDNVVVIDCMTFVPEHIPVLKALDELQLSPLPFQEGALLNLNVTSGDKSLINFEEEYRKLASRNSPSDSEIESNCSEPESEEKSDFKFNHSLYKLPSTSDLIDFLVSASKLNPLIQIRRDEQKTQELTYELCKLVEETTLDREQLKSFVGSLVEPVHLTQGPPGTGKSYLGVVIVRALIKIRSAWMSVAQSVGEMPILVLSYKNHAIDEFLVDLVKSERSVSLIRIGGSCNDPSLQPYLEQNQSIYKMETKKNRAILEKLHRQKIMYQEMSNKLSPLLNHAALKDSIPVDKEAADAKTEASFCASVYLCNVIFRIHTIEEFISRKEAKNCLVDTECDSTGSGDNDVNSTNGDGDDVSDIWFRLFPDVENGSILGINTKDVQALYQRVEHYHVQIPEIFFNWINGSNPLAKCGDSECSQTVIDHGYKYCDKHTCRYGEDIGKRCVHARLPNHVLLCEHHACQYEECDAVKLEDPQLYCEDHACFVCIQQNGIAQKGEDDPPRNTCTSHQLCAALTSDGSSCQNLAISDTTFCSEHALPICTFKDNNGKRCSSYVISRGVPYCDKHKPKERSEPVVQAKIITGSSCKAFSKKKKRPCHGNPMRGFEYCKDHINAVTERSETEVVQSWDTTSVQHVILQQLEEVSNSSLQKPPEKIMKSDTNIASNGQYEKPHLVEKIDSVNDEAFTTDDFDQQDEFYDAVADEELQPDNEVVKPDDDEDLFDEDDQFEHVRDVHVIEDREKEEISDDEMQSDATELEDDSVLTMELIPVSAWTWEMTLEERWTQAQALERKYKMLLSKLNEIRNCEIENTREKYHKSKVRAKSRIYEGKEVVGGTIVGCIQRLDAIRKIKPFAILVEEASEVLEPLLFSCLGEETVKFEMIGDHLQLKPSVMSKIVFERKNR